MTVVFPFLGIHIVESYGYSFVFSHENIAWECYNGYYGLTLKLEQYVALVGGE